MVYQNVIFLHQYVLVARFVDLLAEVSNFLEVFLLMDAYFFDEQTMMQSLDILFDILVM